MQIIKLMLATWSWSVILVLVFFLGRIAYFYEKTSGQSVGYRLLVVPACLFMTGAIYYLFVRGNVDFVTEPIGDLLLMLGGLFLLLFSVRLQELMTGERR